MPSKTPTDPAATYAALDPNRAVLRVEGADAETFLQGLVTNDVKTAGPDAAVYAAMLTPQGKYLFDMILTRPGPEAFVLDVAASQAPALAKRLSMYKLRAAVTIEADPDAQVALAWREAGPLEPLPDAVADPRDARLGLRAIGPDALAAFAALSPAAGDLAAYDALRLACAAPASGADLTGDSYPLEMDFERLNGVDFKKGCYVGQEVTARMKHKATLKKGLRRVRVDGPAPEAGAEITVAGKPAGVMGSSRGALGLALLRLDRLDGGALLAGEATLTPLDD